MSAAFNNDVYKHKSSGKLYRVVNNEAMVKMDGKWTKYMVIYTPLYKCPDGYYFVRTIEDFDKHFEMV